MPISAARLAALRWELSAAEADWDRVDQHDDSAALVRESIGPRIWQLRAAIAKTQASMTQSVGGRS